MSFALFWLGEYANVILMCAQRHPVLGRLAAAALNRHPLRDPGLDLAVRQDLLFFFIFGWVKATVPRYRYDQLMRLGWKIFLPLSLLFVVLISGWLMLTRYGGWMIGPAHQVLHHCGSSFSAHALTLKYFFKPKATINTCSRRRRRARASPASMLRRYPNGEERCHRLQAVRGGVPGAGHDHRSSRARTAAAAPPATTSTWSNASTAGCAQRPAPSMRSSRGRTSNSRPRRARNCYTTRRNARQRRQVGAGDRREPCRRCGVSVGGAACQHQGLPRSSAGS